MMETMNDFFARRRVFFLFLLALTGLSACSVSDPIPPVPEDEEEVSSPFLPGRVTVQFDDKTAALIEQSLREGAAVATRAPQLGGVLDGMGIKSIRRVFPDAGEYEPRTRREGLHRFYYIEFDEQIPATRAAGDLAGMPGVVTVSPQLPVRLRTFNDPYFGSQWHYVNSRYKDVDINVQRVWDEFTVGNNAVIVSVVDEGVYMQHEDLAGNLIPCLEDGTGSYNFNNDTPTVVPFEGHGTHVAGVISAISNNGIGVAGIAGGDAAAGIPGVKVLSCQIFDLYGNTPDLFQAIKHGADHGAVILQCSWGFSPDLDGDGFTTDEEIALYRSYTIDNLPEYKAAIDYFIKYAGCDNDGNQLPDSPMKGGVAIFAAGNDNFDYDPLVSYEPIIAVGAFGATGNKASYSNYGEWVDIAAPGGDAKQGIYSTLLGNSYGGADWQGTSMACPHVSGVAALLVSYFGGPGFTAEECRTRILRGSVANFFTGSRYIGRKLDAYGAFTFDLDTPVVPPVLAWAGNLPSTLHHKAVIDIPLTVSDPNGQRVFLSVTPGTAGASIQGDAATGYSLRLDAAALGAGSHDIQVTATNEDKAQATISLSVSVQKNRAPAFAGDAPSYLVLDEPGQSKTLKLNELTSDADGDAITFSASLDAPELATIDISENGTLTVSALQSGTSTLHITASDGLLEGKWDLPVAVRNPARPVSLFPTVTFSPLTLTVDTLEMTGVSIVVYSANGAQVLTLEKEGCLFQPVKISVASLAPGSYTVKATFEGATYSFPFTKI